MDFAGELMDNLRVANRCGSGDGTKDGEGKEREARRREGHKARTEERSQAERRDEGEGGL